MADFESFAYPDDPAVLGIEFETVTYETPLGPVESWLFPGVEETWIIAVHGAGPIEPSSCVLPDRCPISVTRSW